MSLRRVNARLLAVTAPSGPEQRVDDWDVQTSPPAGTTPGVKWSGSVDAYYVEKITRTTGDTADNVATYTLYLSTADLPAALDADDLLVFSAMGTTQRARVKLLARSDAPVSPSLRTSSLELELVQ